MRNVGIFAEKNQIKEENNEDEEKAKESRKRTSRKNRDLKNKIGSLSTLKKEDLKKRIAPKISTSLSSSRKKKKSKWLDRINPFEVGKQLRENLESVSASLSSKTERSKSFYFDDRFSENPLLNTVEEKDAPEVLVVGATGEVGRLVVRRLQQNGGYRVRVLVRDLYSRTLNLLGTGVTYCQGDLSGTESLEYAVTDVDKIVFCAGAPRSDVDNFQKKFETYVDENLIKQKSKVKEEEEAIDWKRVEQIVSVRAKLAEQIDYIGMQNLVRAYQNVRHADYGTSQAAKRTLFKFDFKRQDNFNLFNVDNKLDEEEEEEEMNDTGVADKQGPKIKNTQTQWLQNKFGHGVFFGKIPNDAFINQYEFEAAIVSDRIRSQQDSQQGIDFSKIFSGFLIRLCADGGIYELFIRTQDYETFGIEYTCEFCTTGKQHKDGNLSSNKFSSIRLPFSFFKPCFSGRNAFRATPQQQEKLLQRKFYGEDIRHLGIRFRSERNKSSSNGNPTAQRLQNLDNKKRNDKRFYLALSYIKVYRSTLEPEFVYLSDARIPFGKKNTLVLHDSRKIINTQKTKTIENEILGESLSQTTTAPSLMNRIDEETYFKFCGEQVLQNSGLCYSIIRIEGYNDLPSGESSTIRLQQSNEDCTAVSRAEVAEVCAKCLSDPNACNVSFYITKSNRKQYQTSLNMEEDISDKIAQLQPDS